MDARDYKLVEFATKISELPDRITGSPEWLKAQFDARGIELQEAFNAFLDALAAVGGAALIGGEDAGGGSITVQGHLSGTGNPHGVTAAQTGAYTKAETVAKITEMLVAAGAGDMLKSVYDPTGRERDVYAYTDEAIAAAITTALNTEV